MVKVYTDAFYLFPISSFRFVCVSVRILHWAIEFLVLIAKYMDRYSTLKSVVQRQISDR